MKLINKSIILLLTLSFISLSGYSQSTKDSILQDSTIKEINIYLNKGLQARKIVPILNKQISKDSSIIMSLRDSIYEYRTTRSLLLNKVYQLSYVVTYQYKTIIRQKWIIRGLEALVVATFVYAITK